MRVCAKAEVAQGLEKTARGISTRHYGPSLWNQITPSVGGVVFSGRAVPPPFATAPHT